MQEVVVVRIHLVMETIVVWIQTIITHIVVVVMQRNITTNKKMDGDILMLKKQLNLAKYNALVLLDVQKILI